MDAFDIGIYALINVPNVGDADSYDRSFQTNRDTITQAQEAIQNYKSIQHNYKDTIDKSSNIPFIFKAIVLDYPKYNIYYMDSNNKLVSLSDDSTLAL